MTDPAMVRDSLMTGDDPPALIGGRCEACGHDHFPATDTCPYCGSEAIGSVRLPAGGTLWAWTAVTSAPPGYTGRVPFGFGVVELEGRLRIVTRLTQADPSALRAGQPMRLVRDEVAPAGPEEGAVWSWAFAPSEGVTP